MGGDTATPDLTRGASPETVLAVRFTVTRDEAVEAFVQLMSGTLWVIFTEALLIAGGALVLGATGQAAVFVVAAVVGFRLLAIWRMLSQEQRHRHEVTFTERGFTVTSPDHSSTWRWSGVIRLSETGGLILLWISARGFIWLPSRVLSADDRVRLRQLAHGRHEPRPLIDRDDERSAPRIPTRPAAEARALRRQPPGQ